MPHPYRTVAPLLLLALCSSACLADAVDDLHALTLADQAPVQSQQQRDWQFFTEGMYGYAFLKNGYQHIPMARLSADLFVDTRATESLRFIFANRLDGQSYDGKFSHVNTLKEAYFSWQASPSLVFDLGRINQRNGMAAAYNPSDFFKAGAVRSVVSTAPASLRENRLGSGMLRAQTFWPGGSASAIYSPQLADHRDSAPFALDLGASNPANRWMLSFSHALSATLSPQFLLYGEAHQSPQLAFNLSALASDALSVHLEYRGGRSKAQLDPNAPQRYYSRLASGASYTFPAKITLTAEYQYNQAALKHAEWSALAQDPAQYWSYRSRVFSAQDIPTQHAAFFYSSWSDAIWPQLDLNWMLRADWVDHSLQSWLEARYHLEQAELALQWQSQSGHRMSHFGALPDSVQLLFKYYY